MLLDIHTHKPLPQPEAVADLSAMLAETGELPVVLSEGDGAYSVGIHPWTTLEAPSEALWKLIETAAGLENVRALGECGIDLTKGGPMFRQLQVMKRMVEISERVRKPLVIHDVKVHDIIIGLRRDLNPKQNWVIHGFRGKSQLAGQLLHAGCRLSFGEMFNPDTVRALPTEMILAETDESGLSIEEIIARLSEARGENMLEAIRENTADFLLSR